MAGAAGNPIWVWAPSDDLAPPAIFPLTSAPDIAIMQGPDSHLLMVAFANAQMVYYDMSYGRSSAWLPASFVSPPASTTYSYSPTICTQSANNDFTRHVAAVAGGELYYAHSAKDWPTDGSAVSFSTWQRAGSAVPRSSPDCVVTSDNTVHIVLLTSTGTIADVHRTGVSGNWATTDLGSF